MADSFIAGCWDPKNASPDQLIPLLYKTSAAAEITLCQLHFHSTKNVKNCHISLDNMQPINAPDDAEAKRTKVHEGDLLISITADLGRTGVVTKEIANHGAYINQHLTCIRLKRNSLEPLYVAYFMESPAGKEQFTSKNRRAVKAGLNFNSINTLRLLVPPKSVQEEFINFVAQVDKSKLFLSRVA